MNYLGYTYAEHNIHLNDAEHLLNDAIALNPNSAAYMDSLGWIYYKLGKYKKAEDFLKTAAEKSADPLIYDHLGDVLAAQGHADETVMVWDKSLRIAPNQKSLRKKLRKYIAALPEKTKTPLFARRALANFEDIAMIGGVVQLKACEKGPCFESMGQFDYQNKKILTIEIPGPLSGPLMKVTKKFGKPATYGAIHPQLQNADYYVTRACGRLEELLSGQVFRPTTSNVTFDFNPRDGALNAVHWADDAGDDQLRHSGFFIAAKENAKTWLEWIDTKSGFRIRLEFKRPAITTITAQKGRSDDDE
jgi:tetratricopeptide (TPR) repeat protein